MSVQSRTPLPNNRPLAAMFIRRDTPAPIDQPDATNAEAPEQPAARPATPVWGPVDDQALSAQDPVNDQASLQAVRQQDAPMYCDNTFFTICTIVARIVIVLK